MTFIGCACVLDRLGPAELIPHLEARTAAPARQDIVELLAHEQSFRQEMPTYHADMEERVTATIKWLVEQGYAPVSWDRGCLGIV